MMLPFLAAIAICAAGPRVSCIVDGDTLHLNGEKIRLENIDTPETDQAKCPAERAAGERAKLRLHALANAGPVYLQRTGRDRYGRTLARVFVNGVDVGDQLVREGFARPYDGGRRPWC